MKSKTLARIGAAAACCAVAFGASGAATGSQYTHATVVKETSEPWVPHVAETAGEPTPVAYTVAEAGSQMVVGGRFQTVENGDRSTQYSRHNVFAFDAATGAVNPSFAPVVDGSVWTAVSNGTAVWIGGAFGTVDGQPRSAVAKLDLATGRLDPDFRPALGRGRVTDMQLHAGRLVIAGTIKGRLLAVNRFTGSTTGYIRNAVQGRLSTSSTPTQVFKFDISSDGRHLAAVGNFTEVDGRPRPRMFLLDRILRAWKVSAWNYGPNKLDCTSTRPFAAAYLQDVDFAPDSSWFAVAAFGYMYQTGQRGLQLCDSVSRFETANLDPVRPTWINYTGGDSLKSVAVTGAAVYVQGHNRWLDNPYGRDSQGPGAVERLGGGAVDPVTGRALPWNPVMPQQSGGFQITPTAKGVWFATDGTLFGGGYHRGIRFASLP